MAVINHIHAVIGGEIPALDWFFQNRSPVTIRGYQYLLYPAILSAGFKDKTVSGIRAAWLIFGQSGSAGAGAGGNAATKHHLIPGVVFPPAGIVTGVRI